MGCSNEMAGLYSTWLIATTRPATPSHASDRHLAAPALRFFPSEGKCNFVVDWAADPTRGPDAAAANQTLYPDGTHPSQAGRSNMEARYFPSCSQLSDSYFGLIGFAPGAERNRADESVCVSATE